MLAYMYQSHYYSLSRTISSEICEFSNSHSLFWSQLNTKSFYVKLFSCTC